MARKLREGGEDWIDGNLCAGGLGVSSSGIALQTLTVRSVYDRDGWDPETVKQLWELVASCWSEGEGDGAREGAWEFLKVCAENGLGVVFDW